MRANSSVANIINNISLLQEDKRVELLAKENKIKAKEIEQQKEKQRLKDEDASIVEQDINFLTIKRDKILDEMSTYNNPVVVDFSSDYESASLKYFELKKHIEEMRNKPYDIRVNKISLLSALALKFAVAIVVAFIITRLIGDNKILLENFTAITTFQNIFNSKGISADNVGLILDFIVQDLIMITVFTFIISIGFRNSEKSYLNKARKCALIGFIISIVGLFISAMLYAY